MPVKTRQLPLVDDDFVIELVSVKMPPEDGKGRSCGFSKTCKKTATEYNRARSSCNILIAALSCKTHSDEMMQVLQRMRVEEIAASVPVDLRSGRVRNARHKASSLYTKILDAVTDPSGPMHPIAIHQCMLEAAALTYLADCLDWMMNREVVLSSEELRRFG